MADFGVLLDLLTSTILGPKSTSGKDRGVTAVSFLEVWDVTQSKHVDR